MRMLVISHKRCWMSPASETGFATDGGFPMQMRTLAELFDATTLALPCAGGQAPEGLTPIEGPRLAVVPLGELSGTGVRRKARVPLWFARHAGILSRLVRIADAVHAPIPGDVGTIGMVLAVAFGKPLFVRHCGNWLEQATAAEHFWRYAMERLAGGRNVMLATGGAPYVPSSRNPAIRWIFATSLSELDLHRESAGPRRGWIGPRLITVCRQVREKGTWLILESLPQLAARYPAVGLDVVGDGPAIGSLRQKAERLGVTSRVAFHGNVTHDRVLALLRGADLFCFPTAAHEGFPKAVLEALACGLPVITTGVSVLPHLLAEGCGHVMDERTVDGLVRAVCECLDDPQRYAALSARAVAVSRRYSLETWRDTIAGHLHEAWGPLKRYA